MCITVYNDNTLTYEVLMAHRCNVRYHKSNAENKSRKKNYGSVRGTTRF
jgi:hypothetical protein